jgi:hypothetical protein
VAILKPHHLDLLRTIVERNGTMAVADVDGRTLRPLKTEDLAAEVDGRVLATASGRTRLQQLASAASESNQTSQGPLSQQQEDMLRYLLRQTGPVPEEHLDARVLRGLRSRGLVSEMAGWVRPSEQAHMHLEKHVTRQHVSRQRRSDSASTARAAAIYRAAEQLERALPRDAELTVREMPAYADDVVAGLRRLARQLEGRTGTAS